MRNILWLPILVLTIALPVTIARADSPSTLRIIGSDGKSMDFTQEQIRTKFAADIHTVDHASKDGKHTFGCVPLLSILQAQGVPTEFKMNMGADPKLKNFNLRFAVVVQGSDGYTAVFSLGELLPDIGNHDVWVAVDEDSKPLPEAGGPVEVLANGDDKPARNVHGVTKIIVLDLTQLIPQQPTTQPTAN